VPLPCLVTHPQLRRWIRWGLERVCTDLVNAGGRDTLALHLAHEASRLLLSIHEPPHFAARRRLEPSLGRKDVLIDVAVARGLEALGSLVDEYPNSLMEGNIPPDAGAKRAPGHLGP